MSDSTPAKIPATPAPFLGLVMIIRDCQDTIAGLLESIRGAFDEIILVDTGSMDKTREVVSKHLLGIDVDQFAGHFYALQGSHEVSVILGRFTWVNDFAAARNYADSLSTAMWRVWLDSDDTWPAAKDFRKWLEKNDREKPEVNAVSIIYDYNGDGSFLQDKFRALRHDAAAGLTWTWQGAIHEEPACSKPKVSCVISDPKSAVIHHKSQKGVLKSLIRNIEICSGIRARAEQTGDRVQVGTMSFFMGNYTRALSQVLLAKSQDTSPPENTPEIRAEALIDSQGFARDAEGYYQEAAEILPGSNLGSYALVELSQMALEGGDHDAAVDWAGAAAAHTPELPEGHNALGLALSRAGEHERACMVFDRVRATPPSAGIRSNQDRIFNLGTCLLAAATSYFATGRTGDAAGALEAIPPDISRHPKIQGNASRLQSGIMKLRGLDYLNGYINFCLWSAQPLLALEILGTDTTPGLIPASISDAKYVANKKREILAKLPQLGSWENYKKTYSTKTIKNYDTKNHFPEMVHTLARSQAVYAWAERATPTTATSTGTDGTGTDGVIQVCSIGPESGMIEERVLEINPKIHLDICDASDLAENTTVKRLQEKFPGRVSHHQMAGYTDWGHTAYDAIFYFEVIEHLPWPENSLEVLRSMLALDGVLFLSTPVADRWIETHHSDPVRPDQSNSGVDWSWHLTAWNPSGMWAMIREAGLDGRLETSDLGTTYLATLKLASRTRAKRVSIYVPGTPLPFDPDSIHTGHIGGSEEAVVHAAPALARCGYEVTVYSPRPKKKPQADGREASTIHGQDGVLWRDSSEFDPLGDEHQTVMYWRCPAIAREPWFTQAKHQKIGWLHDSCYFVSELSDGTTPAEAAEARACYEKFDKIILLSQAHAAAIKKWDGYDGKNIVFALNGIDTASFPTLTKEEEKTRDPGLVVWGASPDRGLDRLLTIWPEVAKEVPTAKLRIYYSWGQLEKRNPKASEALKAQIAGLATQGFDVVLVGGVSHDELHQVYRKANVYAYFNAFHEISCISGMKTQATGCVMLTTTYGSLPETLNNRHCLPMDPYAKSSLAPYRDELIRLLKNPVPFSERLQVSEEAKTRFDWKTVAKRFAEILEEDK